MATSQSTTPQEEDSDEEFYEAQEPADLSASMSTSSDKTKEMHCEECEGHSNVYRTADGFCVDCGEYKCSLCLEYHRRHYKNHYLQDKANMPQDFCFEKCLTHPTLLIKFYCEQCETIACSVCKTHTHHNCDKVKHLPTLANGIVHSKELKHLKENLEELSKNEEKMKIQIKDQCEMTDFMEARSKSTITKHRNKLISIYREKQNNFIGEFDKRFEETVARLKNERKQLVKKLALKQQNFDQRICTAGIIIIKDVKSLNTRLESLKKENTCLSITLKGQTDALVHAQALGQNCKLVISMKDTENSMIRLRQNILKLQDYHLEYYAIEPLEQIPSFKSLETTTSFFSYKELPKSSFAKVATFYKEIQLKSPCAYGSICLLPGNKLLAADCSNRLINIVEDIHTNTRSYDLIEMASCPWGITKVEDNKVAVTFPYEGIVRLITFSDSMTVISTDDITVGVQCRGIAYSNNNLIVSYDTWPGKIQILDMSGKVLKCFDKFCSGKPLFWQPSFLTLSPDNKTIYVSDWSRYTVTSMTLDGKVKATYMDEQLKRPSQLTVDESGTVYVCGFVLNNVHQLSCDLIKVKILLDERQGMICPQSVAYCQNNRRLYVGMDSNIKVVNLSLTGL